MKRCSLILLGLALLVCVVAIASPAAAASLKCPPLPVAAGHVCECKVANYATSTDTNVTIRLYDHNGSLQNECGPGSIPPKGAAFCAAFFAGSDNCTCEVTGQSGSARASLSVEIDLGESAQASVECR